MVVCIAKKPLILLHLGLCTKKANGAALLRNALWAIGVCLGLHSLKPIPNTLYFLENHDMVGKGALLKTRESIMERW